MTNLKLSVTQINAFNSELNPICHLLALLKAYLILHVGKIRVKQVSFPFQASVDKFCTVSVALYFVTHIKGIVHHITAREDPEGK
jgi:hypothetical protein